MTEHDEPNRFRGLRQMHETNERYLLYVRLLVAYGLPKSEAENRALRQILAEGR